MPGFVKKCPFVRQKVEEDVKVLDYRHCSLQDIPTDVFNRERTLEELYADCNQIRDLPRELFYCHGLRKLSISDNEITSIPPAISSLANLEELDISKNGIIDVPENIKGCKYLRSIDASVNPLGKLPEGITYLANLTHLYLNDTFLDYLPGSFGRMVTLKILELRENHLKTLPRSFSRLVELQRLDIGNNELTELSDMIGGLSNLLELWCDNNQITTIANNIGNLKQLMFIDASNNQLQHLPTEIEECISLADLHLTSNNLVDLPDSIGNLINLTSLKVDDNQLTCLPKTLGGLSSLSELNVSTNDLEELPTSIGLLRNLRTIYADENMLRFIPAEIGSCSGITVLSLRSNKLTYIPDELGRIPRLRVLNLSDNLLRYLPFSIVKLKELQALWLTENQTRPLIPLQSEYEPDTGRKILTCYLLPQGQMERNDERDPMGDNDSFHASMWDEERLRRQQIHFAFVDDCDEAGKLVRCPTPYPKEMKEKVRHARNLALRHMMNVGEGGGELVLGAVGVSRTTELSSQMAGNFDETNQQDFSYTKTSEYSDTRVREARITKPTSPGLQETHRLYRFDKEKLMKDKVRMQHRLSVPDFSGDAKVSLKDTRNKNMTAGETSLARGSGSVPDLSIVSNRESTPAVTSMTIAASSTYDDLYSKHIAHRHRGHRSRRLREYDSDTGYRSDGEAIRFPHEYRSKSGRGTSSEIFSVQSQPLAHHSYNHHHHRGRGREGRGYASDIGGYAGGSSFPTANAAAAAFQKKIHPLGPLPAASMPHDLNTAAQSPVVIPKSSKDFRPYSPSKSEPHQYGSRPGSDYMPSNIRSSRDHTSQYDRISNSSDMVTTPANSGPAVQIPVNLLQRQTNSGVQSQINFNKDLPPPAYKKPNLQSVSERNLAVLHSLHSATPSPVFHKGSSMDQNSQMLSQSLPSAPAVHASLSMKGHKGGNLYAIVEQSSSLQTFLPSQTTPSGQPVVTPSTYTSTPPHQRPESRSPGPNTYRLLSDSSSSHAYSSYARMKTPSPVANVSPLGFHPGIPNQSQSSPCGFHGSNRYSDLPVTSREKLNFSDYADIDQIYQGHFHSDDFGKLRGMSPHQYNKTSRSGSTSSQIGCASQIGSVYHPGEGPRRHDQSSSSDSRSDMHNYSSSRESPYLGIASYGLAQSSSRQDRSYDHYSGTFDTGNYEDLTVIPSQEQSSQVSSSTDSGYGHGHLVYDYSGDYNKGESKGYSVQGHRGPHVAEVTAVPSPQRLNLVRGSENVHSREITPVKDIIMHSTQDHTDQFHLTIHKNPGLGFSIAGGIGSHGNPYKENDIGIFVTKVSPDGPASKLLRPGDKILEVNKVDFQAIEHTQAVAVLKTNSTVHLLVERIQKVNLV